MTNQSIAAGKRFAKTAAATVIALFVIVSIFASVVFAADNSGYKVKILQDGEEISVTTTETEPIKILKSAGITLDSNDRLDCSGFVEGKGRKIVVKKCKTINIERNGVIEAHRVYSNTVKGAFKERGITLAKNERMNYKPTAKVKDGMVIKIKPSFIVTLKADGKTKKYRVIEGNVSSLIKQSGVKLDNNDYTKPSGKAALKKGMVVKVYRVSYKKQTVTKKIKYSTKKVKDKNLELGKTEVVKEGKNGKKKVTYNVKYLNGKKVKKVKVNQKVTQKATKKVVKVGAKELKGTQDREPNGVESAWGFTVGQEIDGRYTHYCACATCNGNSNGITSSGKRIYNGMANPYYIACNWLPLGTVLNVDGTLYIVVDRGGSGLSRTGRIDIFTPGGHAECYRLGTGSCKITIVRLGW